MTENKLAALGVSPVMLRNAKMYYRLRLAHDDGTPTLELGAASVRHVLDERDAVHRDATQRARLDAQAEEREVMQARMADQGQGHKPQGPARAWSTAEARHISRARHRPTEYVTVKDADTGCYLGTVARPDRGAGALDTLAESTCTHAPKSWAQPRAQYGSETLRAHRVQLAAIRILVHWLRYVAHNY